jgi:hypothetical protein
MAFSTADVIHENLGIKNAGSIVFVGKERGIKWVKGLKGDLRLKPQAINISRAKCSNNKKDYLDGELTALYRKHIFAEMKLRSLIPNFYIHVSLSDLYIPAIGPRQTDRGNI